MDETGFGDARIGPLLAVVEAYRREACERSLAQARAEALAIVGQGRGEARQRVHRAVEEEKTRSRTQLAAASAHLQTLRRHHRQEQTSALLAAAWERLVSALRQRWHDPALRRAWTAQLLREAREVLPGGAWEISHPPDLPEDELQRLREWVPASPGQPVQWRADAQLAVGLRIRASGVVLDGTLDGLVRDRARLQGELLAALEAAA